MKRQIMLERLVYLSVVFLILILSSCSNDDEGDVPPPPVEPVVAVVTTNPVATLVSGEAIVGGNIPSDGGAPITRRGVTWGFSPNPNLNDNVVELGEGAGAFSTTITELSSSTNYHIRAFAENSVGVSFGESRAFTTLGEVGGISTPGSGVTDISGHFYPSVIINNVEWMSTNLSVSRFANGDTIENILSNPAWNSATIPAWSVYLNDVALGIIYGKLYNWAAATDSRGLCPTGWHVPSAVEMNDLLIQLGGALQAGGKIKETGVQFWQPPNTGASNISGLSGKPSGRRSDFGGFNEVGQSGIWWSNSPAPLTGAMALYFITESTAAEIAPAPLSHGLAVRCVKD